MDKYTWQEAGSSYLPGELIAAFLWAQLEEAGEITENRMACWRRYHEMLEPLEREGVLRRPSIPSHCRHNAHMYYILLAPDIDRQPVLNELKKQGIDAVFHYVPLHSAPAGRRYGRVHGAMNRTDSLSARLIRLPLWYGMARAAQEKTVETLRAALHR